MLAVLICKQTPSGMRIMAASSSRNEPQRANKKGDPGRKELLRSPSNLSEGCSLSCWRAVTGERIANNLFVSVALLLLLLDDVDCCGAFDEGGSAAGAGAGAGVLLPLPLLLS